MLAGQIGSRRPRIRDLVALRGRGSRRQSGWLVKPRSDALYPGTIRHEIRGDSQIARAGKAVSSVLDG
jgi:hypothetical protein